MDLVLLTRVVKQMVDLVVDVVASTNLRAEWCELRLLLCTERGESGCCWWPRPPLRVPALLTITGYAGH
jgi:hypothetical protein